ncbi:MAG: hypothetical protein ACI88H_000416 [Cocleimonas sp.]|jgi:hypothetical protein
MIKNAIIGLLALNVFYFVWVLVAGSAGYTAPPKYEEGVPGLTVLPEYTNKSYQRGTSGTPSSCYAFGPFDSEKSAQIIANKINGFGLWTDITNQQTMQTLNFLVYLQPFKSRQEALKVITEISKHEIKEYKLVESGPYKNAIALGSFNDLDQARRHSEYVRFLGYDARYTTQKKRKEVYWINYDEPFGKNVPVMRWAKEIDEKSSAQKIPKACA